VAENPGAGGKTSNCLKQTSACAFRFDRCPAKYTPAGGHTQTSPVTPSSVAQSVIQNFVVLY